MATRTMRYRVGVSVYDAPERLEEGPERDKEDEEMAMRVLNATIPHPDSRIATDRAGESVTVIVSDWEITS